jgi:hypothetical protein
MIDVDFVDDFQNWKFEAILFIFDKFFSSIFCQEGFQNTDKPYFLSDEPFSLMVYILVKLFEFSVFNKTKVVYCDSIHFSKIF